MSAVVTRDFGALQFLLYIMTVSSKSRNWERKQIDFSSFTSLSLPTDLQYFVTVNDSTED